MTWDGFKRQGFKRAEDNPRNLNESKRLMKIHEKLYSLFYSAKSNDFVLFCFCSFTRMLAEGSAIRRRLGERKDCFGHAVALCLSGFDVWHRSRGCLNRGFGSTPRRIEQISKPVSSIPTGRNKQIAESLQGIYPIGVYPHTFALSL